MNVPSLSRTTLLTLAAALALVPAAAWGCGNQEGGATADASGPAVQTPPQQEPELVDLGQLGFNEGNEDTAVLGVVEFSDFGCVFCAAFHEETYPALYEEFVQAGEVLWKYVPITIGGFPNGDLAGLAGTCAGQLDDFAPLRDHLYEQREEWMASDRGADLFVEYAAEVGLDADAFRSCMSSEEVRAELEMNNRMAREIGVSGTPTFIVAGMPVRGAPPLEGFREALREMVSQGRPAQPEGTPPGPP